MSGPVDLEAVVQTAEGSHHDKLVALLIGLVALLASCLAVLQVVHGTDEARAHAMAARLTADVTTRMNASAQLHELRLQSAQRAALGSMEGVGRQIVTLEDGGGVGEAIGGAIFEAGQRLIGLADRVGVLPRPGEGPLDPYTRLALASTQSEQEAMSLDQADLVEAASTAGSRGSLVLLGLSLVALAGVLAGLSALVRTGRAERVTLVGGYVLLCLALVAGLASLLPSAP